MRNIFRRKKPAIKSEYSYPVYLTNNDDRHYIVIYSEKEGYHFCLGSHLCGNIRAFTTTVPIIYQYVNTTLYKQITEDEFIDALDSCDYLTTKNKLYVLMKK